MFGSGTNNRLGCEAYYLRDGTSSLLHDGFSDNKRTIYTKIRLVEPVYIFSQAWRTLCEGTSL
jgi:cell wall assembly regulator SMI1